MTMIKAICDSVHNQLENHSMFRRLIMVLSIAYVFYATDALKIIILEAFGTDLNGAEISAIITVYVGLPLGAIGYMFNRYTAGRTQQ